MRTLLHLLAVLLLTGLGADLPAQQRAAADPAINRPFLDPDFEQWVNIFESPGRELYARRHQVLQALDLRPGMEVVDLGTGTGFYALLFAGAVGPEGRVFALDISRPFVENVARRAREAGHHNLEARVNSPDALGLSPQSLDLVFTADTYHHFEHPAKMLTSIHQSLRPGGRLVVIDFHRQPGQSSRWVLEHVRAGREQVIEEIEAAGFRLVAEPRVLAQNYFLIFSKAPE